MINFFIEFYIYMCFVCLIIIFMFYVLLENISIKMLCFLFLVKMYVVFIFGIYSILLGKVKL